VGFVLSGHAGFGAHGEDIVCSAVSALSQTAILGLVHLANASPIFHQADGFLNCRISPDLTGESLAQAHIILKTMFLGIKNIADQYPILFTLEKEEV